MLRPHGRVSHQISDTDLETILTDMNALRENGVDGFVFGALTPNRDIDIEKCNEIIQNAHGLPVTFHRAFDMTVPSKKFENVEQIASCGFSRILSSGFYETAELGVDELAAIQEYILENRLDLILMPGCGVTVTNAEQILENTRCKEFHASAKVKVVEEIPKNFEDTRAISKEIENNAYSITDKSIVEQLVAIGKTYLEGK